MAMMKKAKPKQDENQKALKKNLTLSNLIPWETGNKVEIFKCKVTGPNVEIFVEWVQVHAICIFGTHRMNFLFFFVHTCISRQISNVQEFLEKLTSLFSFKPTGHLLLTKT